MMWGSFLILVVFLSVACAQQQQQQQQEHFCADALKTICGTTEAPYDLKTIFAARMCLWDNKEQLDSGCYNFLTNCAPSLVEPCFDSIRTKCSNIVPGDSRIHECLMKNYLDLSVRCAAALEAENVPPEVQSDDFSPAQMKQLLSLVAEDALAKNEEPPPSLIITFTRIFSNMNVFDIFSSGGQVEVVQTAMLDDFYTDDVEMEGNVVSGQVGDDAESSNSNIYIVYADDDVDDDADITDLYTDVDSYYYAAYATYGGEEEVAEYDDKYLLPSSTTMSSSSSSWLPEMILAFFQDKSVKSPSADTSNMINVEPAQAQSSVLPAVEQDLDTESIGDVEVEEVEEPRNMVRRPARTARPEPSSIAPQAVVDAASHLYQVIFGGAATAVTNGKANSVHGESQ